MKLKQRKLFTNFIISVLFTVIVFTAKQALAVGEPLNINAPMSLGDGYSLSAGSFADRSAPSTYFLTPGSTGVSLQLAGAMNVAGLSISGSTISATPVQLNYLNTLSGRTGTGNLVLSASPTLTGTVTAATLNATTLTGAGSGITALNMANASSGTLAVTRGGTGATTSTGTGSVVLSASPTFTGTVTAPTFSGALSGNATTATNVTSLAGTWSGANYFQSNLGATSGSLSSPALQVYATGGNSAFMSFHRGGNYAINMGLDSDNVLRIGGWSASASRWQLDQSGNQAISGNMRISGGGTAVSNTAPLVVQGAYGIRMQLDPGAWSPAVPWQMGPSSSGSNNFAICRTDNCWGMFIPYSTGNGWTFTSDKRLKEDIKDLSGEKSLDAINKIRPVSFRWKNPKQPQDIQTGFIAQEMQQVLPDMISLYGDTKIPLKNGKEETIKDALGVSSTGLIPYMVKAIQEQQKQITELQKQIGVLSKEIQALK